MPITRRDWLRSAASVPPALAAVAPAGARAAGIGPVADPALVARAKAEQTVSVYVAMNGDDLAKIASLFEAQYGIACKTLRLASNGIAPRLAIEQRGGRYECDITITTGYDTEIIKRNGLLATYSVPETKSFLPGYVDPDGYWTSAFTNTNVFMWNTQKIAAAGVPAPVAWADFARPAWHGKFAVFGGSIAWYTGMRRALGREIADPLVRGIGANQPVITATRQLATSLTGTGEYMGAVGVFGNEAQRLKREGQPVDFVNAPPTIAEPTGVGFVKNAPHPNAARLFIRWLLSREMQRELIVGTFHRITARKDVASPPEIWNPRMRVVVSNPADVATYNDDVKTFNAWYGIQA